ncbi:MAG: ATP-dependent helicase [Bacilli bacterium]
MSKIEYNDQQKKVLEFKEGACCVLAGAGSGKTASLVARMKCLVDSGTPGEDITAITFTNYSAKDLKKKKSKMKGLDDIRVGTFHAICKKILYDEGIDTSRQLPLYEIENIFKKIDKKAKCKEIMGYIAFQKVSGIDVNGSLIKDTEHYTAEELRVFYKAYELHKKKKKALDFTDWMIATIKILKEKPDKYAIKYLLVDEQQDNDILQNKLMKLLCPSENIMAIGDIRQSIYGFKGGSPELFMNFDKNYKNATIINLDINYRSCRNIVENSNSFMRKYLGDFRYYSDSIANNKKDGVVEKITSMTKEQEANSVASMIEKDIKMGIKPEDIAVLYRLNSQSFYIENELKTRNIEYHIESNNNFFERKEIKAVVCMLRLIEDLNDNAAYEAIYKTRCHPFNFLSNKLLNDIEDLAAKEDASLLKTSESVRVDKRWQRENLDRFIDILKSLVVQHKKHIGLSTMIKNIIKLLRLEEFINQNYEGDEVSERLESLEALKLFIKNNTLESFLKFIYSSEKTKIKKKSNQIQLMTIHKSKGLEYKKVYIIGIEDGKFPHKKCDIDEEARLFYVGITRPKDELVLSQILEENKFIEEYFK